MQLLVPPLASLRQWLIPQSGTGRNAKQFAFLPTELRRQLIDYIVFGASGLYRLFLEITTTLLWGDGLEEL